MAPPFSLQNMAAPFKRIPTNVLGAPGLDDPLWDSITRLDRLQQAVDVRTKPFLLSFLKVGNFVKNNRGRKYLRESEISEFRTNKGIF